MCLQRESLLTIGNEERLIYKMEILKTELDGLLFVQHKLFEDNRGIYLKTYNSTTFKDLGINLDVKERYLSVSKKNVIRGMHFQVPPKEHVKLVTVISGKILDVVLDIRKGSRSYGSCFSIEISEYDCKTIYIPKGFAHGFKALDNNTIVEYNQTTEYSFKHDNGILYDSFGFNWNVQNPIVSSRDLSFTPLDLFDTPFE